MVEMSLRRRAADGILMVVVTVGGVLLAVSVGSGRSVPVAVSARHATRSPNSPVRTAQVPVPLPVVQNQVPTSQPSTAPFASHAKLQPQKPPNSSTPMSDGQPAAVAAAAMPEPATATVRYGPIPALPALLGNPTSTAAGLPLLANLPVLPMPCSNCFVTGTTIDLVYENGQPANLDTGVMLHHLVLFQPQVDDATCARTTPVGLLGQRVFASGNERTRGYLPEGYGVHFGTGPLTAYFDIMNHTDQLKMVYLTATVRWLPDSTPGIKAVTPVWFDENNCSTSTYPIPAGPTSRTWSWTSTMTGRFVAAGGHVHDGGVRTMLMNETTGQHICSSVAGYGTKPAYMGSIEAMSVCSWDRLGTVRRGEVLSLETDYDSSAPQSDVMGIMIAYLYPTDDLAGGTPAPSSMTDPPAPAPPAVMHHHG